MNQSHPAGRVTPARAAVGRFKGGAHGVTRPALRLIQTRPKHKGPPAAGGPKANHARLGWFGGLGGFRPFGGLKLVLLPFDVSGASFAFLDFVGLLAHNGLYNGISIRLFSGNMLSRCVRFNLYLYFLALLAPGLWSGCQSPGGPRKEASTLRLHLEERGGDPSRIIQVPVYREQPIQVRVSRDPFLSEADVQKAEVVESHGGYAIKVQFDRHGTLVLDMTTTGHAGSKIAIESQFGQARWLAAPLIAQRISDGAIEFTPDATREEAERIVRGLNAVAAELNRHR